MKTKKSFKKKSKTKKHKIYKHKQTRKNNKTKKYLGSGPLDKIVTTGLSTFTKKQNIIPLASTAASTFSSQSPAYRGPIAVPSGYDSNSSNNMKFNNYMDNQKKMISEQVKKDINNQFRDKGKNGSLYDTINKKSTEEILKNLSIKL